MKYIILLLLTICSLGAFSQQKYGWVYTGEVQRWRVAIILDRTKTSPEKTVYGYADFAEQRYVSPPNDPTAAIKRKNTWINIGKYYDAALKPLTGVGSIKGVHPSSRVKYQL